MQCDGGRMMFFLATPWRRLEQITQRSKLDGERSRDVLVVRGIHAASMKRKQQSFDGASNYSNPADTLVAAASDHQDFLASAHLVLTKPPLGASHRVSPAREALPEIERALWTEAQLVDRVHTA